MKNNNTSEQQQQTKTLIIPNNLEGYHYKAYAQAILDQLANPKQIDVNLEKAARTAGLPTNIDPKQLAESDAFSFILDNVGLTDTFIAEALHEDIVNKPQNRVQELKLASQLRGLTESKQKDPNTIHADSVNKAMDLMEKLIDNKTTYEQDPITGDYKPA